MRENRTYGSEGGEARAFPTPITRDEDSRKIVGARLRATRLPLQPDAGQAHSRNSRPPPCKTPTASQL